VEARGREPRPIRPGRRQAPARDAFWRAHASVWLAAGHVTLLSRRLRGRDGPRGPFGLLVTAEVAETMLRAMVEARP
jgi:hypothetical protein